MSPVSPLDLAAIPDALKAHPHWLVWRLETRGGRSTKIPYNAATGHKASSTAPATWSPFEDAVAAYEQGGYSGIGWVFTEAAGIVGVDLDHVRDPETGVIAPWAAEIIKRLDSYTEVSPSGAGLHVFVKGTLPPGRRRKGQVEIYSTARYFTATGAHLPGTPTEIQSRQAELAAVHAEVFAEHAPAKPAGAKVRPRARPAVEPDLEASHPERRPGESEEQDGPGTAQAEVFSLDPQAVAQTRLLKALCANHPKFALTYDRKRTDLADQSPSAYDLSLASFAVQAGWTDQDIVNLLIQSRRTHGDDLKLRRDYYERTLAKARESAASPNGHRSPGGPPIIDVTTVGLPRVAGEAWAALELANTPPRLFRFGSVLVRLDRDDVRGATPTVLGVDGFRYELARAADWTKRREKRAVPVPPPLDVVRDCLVDPNPALPRLRRLVAVPTFAPDGRLVSQPGYDEASGLYYAPEPGLVVPEIPEQPMAAEVAAAREALLEVVVNFPFVEDADRAHVLALALLPVVRDLIDGPTPLHLVEAPASGTGKGLMVEALLRISVGPAVGSTPECGDDDEWRRRLMALLKDAPAAILFDNVTRPVTSGALALALTQPFLKDRLLCVSDTATLPIRCAWVLTGNNVTLSTELARRCIRIRLDAKVDRPWLRYDFQHAPLREWVDQERGRLLAAALTLARAWVAAGRPAWMGRPLGSYEAWSRVLGGILGQAGVSGFLGNLDAFYEATDLEGAAWREFIEAAYAQFGTRRVPTADLLPIARATEGFPLYGEEGRGRQTALGRALMANRDRIFGSLRLVHAGKVHGVARWQILPMGEQEGGLGVHRGTSPPPPHARENTLLRVCRGSVEVPPSTPSPPPPVDAGAGIPASRGPAGMIGVDRAIPTPAPECAGEAPEPGSFDGPTPTRVVNASAAAPPTPRG